MANIFDFKLIFTQIPAILRYLPITLEITIISYFFSMIIGFLVALIKIKQIKVLRRIAAFYVSFTRGTPIIVQLYATYYGIPMLLQYCNYRFGTQFNVNAIPPIVFALVALALNDGAYASESIRAAILAVEKGQIEAAQSMGMTTLQTLRRIIVPEALVVALPSLGNSFIGMVKGTSLVFVTATVEITAGGRLMAARTFRYFEMYVSLAIIYWIITMAITVALNAWERRLRCDEAQTEADRDRNQRLEEKV